jgi:hypothetical protein
MDTRHRGRPAASPDGYFATAGRPAPCPDGYRIFIYVNPVWIDIVNRATLNSVAMFMGSGLHLARVSHEGADEGRSRRVEAGALGVSAQVGGRVMRDGYDLGSRDA